MTTLTPTTTETPVIETLRCNAIIEQTAGEYGFVARCCRQTVAVRTFVSTSGLRVGYCAIAGHEGSVRRRFQERGRMTGWDPLPADEDAAEKAAEWYHRTNSL